DTVTELAKHGTADTVKANVSWNMTFGSEIETLRANTADGLTLGGNEFANALIGGSGGDALNGGDGDDKLNGGAGGDAMARGFGNDTYYVDDVRDTVTELAGQGTADAVKTSVSYTLAGGSEVETLRATTADGVFLRGNELANRVIGGNGDDILDGRL